MTPCKFTKQQRAECIGNLEDTLRVVWDDVTYRSFLCDLLSAVLAGILTQAEAQDMRNRADATWARLYRNAW